MDGFAGAAECGGETGVSTGSAGEHLKERAAFVLITLYARVERKIWVVVRVGEVAVFEARRHAIIFGVFDVPVPDVDAWIAETDFLEAFTGEGFGLFFGFTEPLHTACAYGSGEVRLADVDGEVLHGGAKTAGAVVGEFGAVIYGILKAFVGF